MCQSPCAYATDSVSQQGMPNVTPNDSVSQQRLADERDLTSWQNLPQPVQQPIAKAGPPALHTVQVTGPAAVHCWKRHRAELAQDLESMPDCAPDAGSGDFIGMNDEMTLRSEEAVLDEPSSEASMRFQPCTDDLIAAEQDRQCAIQQEEEERLRSQAVIESDMIDITRWQVPLVQLSTRPVPARKTFEHQLNRQTFCVLLQLVRVLFAVLNHGLRQDGIDCSEAALQDFSTFKTARRTMQVWHYLGLTEMDPELPVLEWAVHFDKESVHGGLTRAMQDALPVHWVSGQGPLRWKLTRACVSLARKLQTEYNAKPQSEEFETQRALRINKWAVEATNQFYLVLHDLSQYVRHGARKEPFALCRPPSQPTKPLNPAPSHGHGNGAVAGSSHGSPSNSTTPILRPEDAGRTLNPVHLHRLTGGSGGLSAELKPTSVVSVSEAKLPKRHNSILDYYTDDTERKRVSHLSLQVIQ